MSVRGAIELCVYLDEFRNIDLFHQGVYMVRTSIHCPGSSTFAYPYNSFSLDGSIPGTPHHLSGEHISDHFAWSRSFLVRYLEEEVPLSEMFLFRTEVPLVTDSKKQELVVDFELLYSNLSGQLDPQEALARAPTAEFEVVSTTQHKLLFPYTLQASFRPVVFDENHCCVVYSYIHYALIEYRYYASPGQDPNSALAQVLFASKTGKLKGYVGAAETDQQYNSLFTLLEKTYNRLREYYLFLVGKCMNEEDRLRLEMYYVPPPLSGPGKAVQLPYVSCKKICMSTSVHSESEEEGSDNENLNTQFSQRVASHDPHKIANSMTLEFNMVSGQIFQLWHRILGVLSKAHRATGRMLQEKFRQNCRSVLGKGSARTVYRTNDLSTHCERRDGNDAQEDKDALRAAGIFDNRLTIEPQPWITEELAILDRTAKNGIFEVSGVDSSLLSRDTKGPYTGFHVFVMVHGLQGSAYDLRMLKNNMNVVFPEALFLLSAANEYDTENEIETQGAKLAEEVCGFIQEWCPRNSLGRLSFIGHSLGGLVVRAALPLLQQYSEKMHLFMSLSSPHLGIIRGTSKLVRAGI